MEHAATSKAQYDTAAAAARDTERPGVIKAETRSLSRPPPSIHSVYSDLKSFYSDGPAHLWNKLFRARSAAALCTARPFFSTTFSYLAAKDARSPRLVYIIAL